MSNLNLSLSPSILAFAQAPSFEVGNPVVHPTLIWDNYYLLWIYLPSPPSPPFPPLYLCICRVQACPPGFWRPGSPGKLSSHGWAEAGSEAQRGGVILKSTRE